MGKITKKDTRIVLSDSYIFNIEDEKGYLYSIRKLFGCDAVLLLK